MFIFSPFTALLRTVLAILLCSALISVCWARNPEYGRASDTDLTDLSLEDLMDIEITSVGKKAQKLSQAAAAVFVITQEDIRRSGVTSIPEALRMVPGIQVARIDASKWAITARGFNSRFANKLLVLMDGRTVYDPIFSGVFWDVQDTLLEDIDRIEVIRGPGATLWGANAVNGVINIITNTAWDTQGGLVSGGVGTEERGFASARYGGKIGAKGAYRFYAKQFERDEAVDAGGSDTSDDWRMYRAGFRTDWKPSDRNVFTCQGDIYDGEAGQKVTSPSLAAPFEETFTDDVPVFGGNLLARWQHTFSGSSDMTLQLYYDRTEREESIGRQDRDTVDFDFQHRFALGNRQEIIWGLGYRYTSDNISSDFPVIFDPDNRSDELFSGFIQDDITLVTDRLRLTLGSKFEYNDYTGFEIQPSGRILWTPHEDHSVWAAVSRAVRTPSRYEDDVTATLRVGLIDMSFPPLPPFQVPAAITAFGDTDNESEDLLALELGYRFQLTERLSLDLATFYNSYDDLIATQAQAMDLTSMPVVIPLVFGNSLDGETYGVELAADWQPLKWWRLQLAYTFFEIDLHPDKNPSEDFFEKNDPDNQVSVRSSMDLRENLELDLWFRYVDEVSNGDIGSYATLDARLGWEPVKNLELSIVGQNLLDPQHPEFVDNGLFNESTEVERSVYGKITWRF